MTDIVKEGRELLANSKELKKGSFVEFDNWLYKNAAKLLDTIEELQKENETVKKQRDGLANFNPDWDMLEATQDSLREHMAICKDQANQVTKLQGVVDAAKEVVGWKYDNLGCGYDGCDLSDFGEDVAVLDKALAELGGNK
ncbi:MAG: hypothetical protein OQK75_11875 [Gammaproteobacteria bacterium]|nr:hypothetical protein [Gammaproteobacteria bacterium]